MSGVVQAVKAEREALLAPIAGRLAVLDEIERLAGSLDEVKATAAKPAATPPRQRPAAAKPEAPRVAAPPVGRDGLGPKASELLEAVRVADRWMSRGEIVAVAGEFHSRTMQRLVERSLVEAKGDTSQRRYRAVQVDNVSGGGRQSEPTIRPVAPPAATGTLDVGASRVLRARILDHLSRRKLNEQSLADHLNANREHVADILGKLLLSDHVELLPDGRYQVPA
jgi:hypothetical protein